MNHQILSNAMRVLVQTSNSNSTIVLSFGAGHHNGKNGLAATIENVLIHQLRLTLKKNIFAVYGGTVTSFIIPTEDILSDISTVGDRKSVV